MTCKDTSVLPVSICLRMTYPLILMCHLFLALLYVPSWTPSFFLVPRCKLFLGKWVKSLLVGKWAFKWGVCKANSSQAPPTHLGWITSVTHTADQSKPRVWSEGHMNLIIINIIHVFFKQKRTPRIVAYIVSSSLQLICQEKIKYV